MMSVPTGRPCEDTQDTEGDHQVVMEAEIRVMGLFQTGNVKDGLQSLEARRGKEGFFPRAFGGSMAL